MPKRSDAGRAAGRGDRRRSRTRRTRRWRAVRRKVCTRAALSPVGRMRHSAIHRMPAKMPSAANSMEGCGPESPIGMGNGGSRRAAAKNRASQRAGFCKVHQRRGARRAGAARAAFSGRLGATAMAAAQRPKKAGAHGAGWRWEALFMAGTIEAMSFTAETRDAEISAEKTNAEAAVRRLAFGREGCERQQGSYSSRARATVRKVLRARVARRS